jgi:predicted transcriptional regulator
VKASSGDDVAFIHMEVYRDNRIDKGIRPQMAAFHLQSEPWLFVFDRSGKVSTRIEGAFSERELQQAISKVTG